MRKMSGKGASVGEAQTGVGDEPPIHKSYSQPASHSLKNTHRERERERETERERDRQRQTDIQTYRQTDRQTERQTERDRERARETTNQTRCSGMRPAGGLCSAD